MAKPEGDRTPKTLEERGFHIIDVHAHPFVKGGYPPAMKAMLASRKYTQPHWVGKSGKGTLEDLKAEFDETGHEVMANDARSHGVKMQPVAWDATSGMGEPPTSNDFVYGLWKGFPDAFFGAWGSVDPWQGQNALHEAERAITELKLIGLKFQQCTQKFRVNDRRFYPLWDLCQQLEAPVQFHIGYTGMGSGAPGGDGLYSMTYCQPLDVDEVAADFPRLKIIALHVGEPWPEVINHVAMHKTNVMRETSGMWPKYFPQCMTYDMNRRLQDKFIFGSEWGVFKLSEILKQWEELDLRPGIMEKVMYKNALNFLGERFEKCGLDLSPWKGLV
ncbi:amidohydrolase family protein [Synergistes jonesii]|uniref:amidohydrolase family protein n=1 Tax=Synergistes jonesii TaxID=2754 RepID=UPI00242F5058|nr:amidohydrolase family protein [Synergistes jonesii]